MKKNFEHRYVFSDQELHSLQFFITQGVEGIFVHNDDFIFNNNQDIVLSVSFIPRLLIKFSGGYYLFKNNAIINQFEEFVHKLAFDEYNLEYTNSIDEYSKLLEFNFFIDHIEVYSTSYEAYNVDYSEIRDTLIVLVSDTSKKIGILADEDFQDSILFWHNTQTIESTLLFRTLNDRVTPKFNKRIVIKYDEITFV